MRRILLLLALTFPLIAFAQRTEFAIGDPIVIAPAAPNGVGLGFNSAYPILLNGNGEILTTMRNIGGSTAEFDAQGRLVLAQGTSITLLADSNSILGGIFVGQQFRDAILDLATAPNGEVFVLTASSDVLEISADTSSVKRIALPDIGFPVVHGKIDLGPDGCTLFYLTHGGEIGRYDFCSGTALPKFVTNIELTSFRVLGDGGVAAGPADGSIQFYDSAARLFKTIPVSGSPVTSIAFDADPAYVWTTSAQYVAKIRISDGRAFVAQPLVVDSIIVRGEHRPTTIDITGITRRRGARH